MKDFTLRQSDVEQRISIFAIRFATILRQSTAKRRFQEAFMSLGRCSTPAIILRAFIQRQEYFSRLVNENSTIK